MSSGAEWVGEWGRGENSKLEEREISQSGEQRENRLEKKKSTGTCGIQVPEREEKDEVQKNYWKNNSWKSFNFGKKHKPRDAEQTPNMKKSKKFTRTQLIVKLLKDKDKEKPLKTMRERLTTYSGKQSEWYGISHQKPWRSINVE